MLLLYVLVVAMLACGAVSGQTAIATFPDPANPMAASFELFAPTPEGCYGYVLTPAVNVNIDTLGVFDFIDGGCPAKRRAVTRAYSGAADGLQTPHQVGVYDSAMVLLTSCTVGTASPTVVDSSSHTVLTCTPSSAVVLTANTPYRVCMSTPGLRVPCTIGDPMVVEPGTYTLSSMVSSISGCVSSLDADALAYPGNAVGDVYFGPMVYLSAATSASPSPTASPSASVAASPAPSGTTAQILVRVPTEVSANVTEATLKQKIGATGTITVVSHSVGQSRRWEPVTHAIRASCLSAPFTDTVTLRFSDATDITKLAALVSKGDASVTTSDFCVARLSSSSSLAVQPSPVSTVIVSESDHIPIGLGVGLGVGLPLIIATLLLAFCCCLKTAPAVPLAAAASAAPAFATDAYTPYTSYTSYSDETSGGDEADEEDEADENEE